MTRSCGASLCSITKSILKILLKMSSLQLRNAALRLGSKLSRRVAPAAASSVLPDGRRSFSVKLKEWQEKGYVDERGLTVFDTLHEMQIRSCKTYSDNQLFGTYTEGPDGKNARFEWMTYHEFSVAVDKCRAVLQDIGMSCTLY